MAATSAKRAAEVVEVRSRRAPEIVTADHAHIPSPAQEIQLRLNDILAEQDAAPDAKKWSARRSSFVIIGVSCVLWLGLAAVVRMALR